MWDAGWEGGALVRRDREDGDLVCGDCVRVWLVRLTAVTAVTVFVSAAAATAMVKGAVDQG